MIRLLSALNSINPECYWIKKIKHISYIVCLPLLIGKNVSNLVLFVSIDQIILILIKNNVLYMLEL